jgi:hypothetical protein
MHLFSIISLAFSCAMLNIPGAEPPALGRIDNFRLLDHLGKSHELHRQSDARAVVLFASGNGCPIARQSVPALKMLREQFADVPVVFWMLNANLQDSRADIIEESAGFEIDFPILKDETQFIARALGIQRTGEVIAINTTDWTVFYRGAIDDRLGYGVQKQQATREFLKEALEAFLAGEKVEPPRTEVKGCLIHFPGIASLESDSQFYSREIAPIIQKNCVPCHRPDNIAPFSFSSYQRVKGWSEMIKEVVLTQRMPPWHADPHYGQFANDRSLAPEEIRKLLAWIDAGAPRGNGPDPLTSAALPEQADGALGKPDVLIPLPREIHLPETGVIPYRYVEVPSPLEEDAWLRAAVVQPGNKSVLHHCLVFVRYPNELAHLQPRNQGGIDGYFTGYVPGMAPVPFPDGTGKFLPKGSTFVFQLHYNTTGRPEVDRTELALYLLPGQPEMELQTRAAAHTELRIPPGARDHEVQAEFVFKQDALLYDLSPHMHYRGSRFSYEAIYPDGRTEMLLSVPAFDFNWQTLYRLAEPKRLPAGTRLLCRGAFDNSSQNPANPDPAQWVRFGEQTYEEMFIGYFNYTDAPPPPKGGGDD